MPVDNTSSNGNEEADSIENTAVGNIFNGGRDQAASAEKTASRIGEDAPGVGDGAWDDENETVSGSTSGYVRKSESGREPWLLRQTAHGALDVMGGFLTPFFQNFQTAATEQLKVHGDPKTASGMASSIKDETYSNVRGKGVKIEPEDQPTISKETENALKRARYQAEGAVLVGKVNTKAYDVALDPSGQKAYIVGSDGLLYGVDLTTGTIRRVMTSEKLGSPCGIALDANNKAYVTDNGGSRLLQVDLSNGDTKTIVTGVKAQGIGLDRNGKAYITDSDRGQLLAVDLKKKEKKIITDGLGLQASGVGLVLDEDGNASKAYTGHWWKTGELWEIDLGNNPTKRPVANADNSPHMVVDDAGTAYVPEHLADILYKVDPDSGERRAAVKSAKGAFSPFGVALDSDNGVIYVSTYEGQLWRFSLSVLQSPELIEIVTE
ncbi:Vgb family protein [Streptomyces noursei]|uniref:Vgb family protein n=1 Tax=Streptomyces noursei TaxID=1971 RepID=UPI00380A4B7C